MRASNLHRGHAVVAVLSVTETISFGVLFYGFTVFLRPMQDEFGWTRAEVAGAFSVALLAQAAAGVLVGRLLDRHGPRVVMTAGSVVASAGTLLWSRVGGLLELYVLWAALGAVMATVLYEPAFATVTAWFVEGRRAALTTVTLVAGFASTIFLPLETWLVEVLGWRNALVVLAVLLAATTVPLHAVVLRRAPASPDAADPVDGQAGATPTDHDRALGGPREIVRSPAFRNLAVAFACSAFVSSSLVVHQVPLLRDVGYSASLAAAATGVLGAMQVPGRVLFAPLLRWAPRRVVTIAVFVALAGGSVLLAVGTSPLLVWTFVVVYGMARGLGTLLRATLVGDLFGVRHYGTVGGVLAAWTTTAVAAGPVVTGVLHDRTGGYDGALWLLVTLGGVAVVAAARVEPGRARRRRTSVIAIAEGET